MIILKYTVGMLYLKTFKIFEREKNKALKSNVMHKCVREKTNNESL